MIKISIKDFVEIVDGVPENLDLSKIVELNPVIDSRGAGLNTFFAAFIGENQDGHDFVEDAIKRGAEFALVSKKVSGPHILVADVLDALTKLARFNRNALNSLTVIGITGSQGKTTAKDLTSHLLKIKGRTVSPKASLNNEVGVPLVLLQCNESTEYCVVEMGARHKGDIAFLTELARPNIGVVLNVGQAHIGEFGSQENIAKTKAELIDGLSEGAIAILGNYDRFTPKMSEGKKLKTIIFGESTNCDVRATDIEVREGRASFDIVMSSGRAPVSLQLLGAHQICNALAAASVASVCGMTIDSIAAGLSTAEPESKWRMQLTEVGDIAVINDAYNANPESMTAALRTLSILAQERGGSSWAFLGKMHELGESSPTEHQLIGKIASEIGIDHLVSVGVKEYSSYGETMVHQVSDFKEAEKFVDHIEPGDVVLIKASRVENLEQLAEAMIEKLKFRSVGK